MRLSKFIETNMEAILSGWEAFACTLLPAAADMDSTALRDHAEHILLAFCRDLDTVQDDAARDRKSKGLAPALMNAHHTAAETHALLRAQSGFNVNQMTSEYRALRSSVLHLWEKACDPAGVYLPDVIRFNEAIDQALAESVAFFNAQIESERNMLLGMLGHDMRNPLQVIQLTTTRLGKLNAGADVAVCVARLSKSVHSLKVLLDDLLDFNRTKLGLGVTMAPAAMDLAVAFGAEIEQLRAAYPGRSILMEVTGQVHGVWDLNRLNQVLDNLVVNAIKYGAFNSPVRVILEGLTGEVRFAVQNHGPTIEPVMLAQIFEPLKRGPDYQLLSATEGSFGLGLYIAREIAVAHHGSIDARSESGETVFTVRLPRLSERTH
jgi:signal transduction histidine kinase